MKVTIPKDFWIGAVVLVAAILYWLEANKIRISPLDDSVGASGLPKALGLALGVLSIILLLRGVGQYIAARKANRIDVDAPSDASGEKKARSLLVLLKPHLRAGGMLAIGIAYIVLVPFLGYVITVTALILAVSLYIGAPANLRTFWLVISGGVFFHLLFVEFLGIPLPTGALVEAILP